MNFIQQNLPAVCFIVSMVFLFIYGRYQYLRGYINGVDDCEYEITEQDYKNFGAKERAEGYSEGFKSGMHTLEKISEDWSCGWVAEAEQWRDIIKSIITKKVINDEQESPKQD